MTQYLTLTRAMTIFVFVVGIGLGAFFYKSKIDQDQTSFYNDVTKACEKADVLIDDLRAELDKNHKIFVPKPPQRENQSVNDKVAYLRWQIDFIGDIQKLRLSKSPSVIVPGRPTGMPRPIGEMIGDNK